MKPRYIVATLALCWAVIAVLSCQPTSVPSPELFPLPGPGPVVPREHQGAQNTLTITVPTSGSSTWVRSTLVRVTSLGLSSTATSTDAVVLYGTNDNTVAVTSASSLGAFNGSTGPQNVGQAGFNIGAYEYFAVKRTTGATTGLTFTIVGDDGSSSGSSSSGAVFVDGGTLTANQGAPNDGGANAWPVADTPAETSLATISPARNLSAVTPSDSTVLSCTSLYVGGAGSVVVDGASSGTSITFSGVIAGTTLPIQVTKVRAATTATGIVCLQ